MCISVLWETDKNEINSIYFVGRINAIKELGGAKKYELCSKLEKRLLNVSVSCNVPFMGTGFTYILSKQEVREFLDNTKHKKV